MGHHSDLTLLPFSFTLPGHATTLGHAGDSGHVLCCKASRLVTHFMHSLNSPGTKGYSTFSVSKKDSSIICLVSSVSSSVCHATRGSQVAYCGFCPRSSFTSPITALSSLAGSGAHARAKQNVNLFSRYEIMRKGNMWKRKKKEGEGKKKIRERRCLLHLYILKLCAGP